MVKGWAIQRVGFVRNISRSRDTDADAGVDEVEPCSRQRAPLDSQAQPSRENTPLSPQTETCSEHAPLVPQAELGQSTDGQELSAPLLGAESPAEPEDADPESMKRRSFRKKTRKRTRLVDTTTLPQSITGQMYLIDRDGRQIVGTEVAPSEDAYSAALVAITRNATVISMRLEQGQPLAFTNISRVVFSLTAMALNLILQVSTLVYINRYVVQLSVRHVQRLYAMFHRDFITDDGQLDEEGWLQSPADEKFQVCNISMWNKTFYYAILFLWALANLSEFRDVERISRQLWYIPTCKKGSDMLHFVDRASFQAGGLCFIVALTSRVRCMLYAFVVLPRTLIAIRLLGLGWRWLSATSTFEDMVLNSLALGFVVNIDELIYHSVLPIITRKQISETRFFMGEPPTTLELAERKERNGYLRTLGWLVLVCCIMFVYGELVQDVLPPTLMAVRDACLTFRQSSDAPLCTKSAFQLWYTRTDCYPIDQ